VNERFIEKLMSTTLKNNIFRVVILFLLVSKTYAQFLDKKFYLLDSIHPDSVSKNDKAILDTYLKNYQTVSSDTARLHQLSIITENVFNDALWPRYNALLLNESRRLQQKYINDTIMFKACLAMEGNALNNVGYYYTNILNDSKTALTYYLKSAAIQNRCNEYKQLVNVYSNIANTYQNTGELIKAFAYFKKAEQLEPLVKDKAIFTAPLNNVAQLYLYINDTANCLLNLKKCLALILKTEDKSIKAHILHNIGILSYKKGDRTGIESMKKALRLREEIGDKKGMSQSYLSLSTYYLSQNRPDLSKENLDKAYAFMGIIKNTTREALFYSNSASYFNHLGDHKKALMFEEKAMEVYQSNRIFTFDMLTCIRQFIVYCNLNKGSEQKKLKAYELKAELETRLNKDNTQKTMMKQDFAKHMEIQEAEFKAAQIIKEEKNKAEKKRQKYIIIGTAIILFIALFFSFFLFRAFKRIQKNNLIISNQKQEVEKQKHIIEEKHKDITDSIAYAHRIQSSLIPSLEKINHFYPSLSILFQPRDVVSGDFYWYVKQEKYHVFALADCTGHGVPGAFMSIIGLNLLNTFVNEKNLQTPNDVLTHLKSGVISSLNANSSELDKRDGMDLALVYFNAHELLFSGANQSIYVLRNKELTEYKGNRQPIGLSEKEEAFITTTIALQKNDRIFLLSDGLPDQFGGGDGKKLKIKKLKDWFIETAHLSLHQQKQVIAEELNKFKGAYEQTDDITLAIIEI
jgi:serine phosphatase RsbU (regulator of sigma subunit)